MAKLKLQPVAPARKPTHRIYRVVGDGDAANWTELGAAWVHKDGKGFSLSCDAIPLTGRIVMRAITERAMAAGGQR